MGDKRNVPNGTPHTEGDKVGNQHKDCTIKVSKLPPAPKYIRPKHLIFDQGVWKEPKDVHHKTDVVANITRRTIGKVSRKKFSEEELQRIKELREQSVPVPMIAKEFDVTPNTIYHMMATWKRKGII